MATTPTVADTSSRPTTAEDVFGVLYEESLRPILGLAESLIDDGYLEGAETILLAMREFFTRADQYGRLIDLWKQLASAHSRPQHVKGCGTDHRGCSPDCTFHQDNELRAVHARIQNALATRKTVLSKKDLKRLDRAATLVERAFRQ